MAKRKFDGELAKKIILGIGAATASVGIVFALAAMPGLGLVAKELVNWYKRENSRRRDRIRKTFKELRRQRLIKEEQMPDRSTKIVLSENGKKYILRFKFDDLKIKPLTQWDKKWRIIIFDIPNKYKYERNVWREKLHALGFHQLQKSVWIYPYPCKKEINFTCEYLKISPFIRLIEASDFEGSDEIKEIFNLTA